MKIIFNGDSWQIDANTLISALGHYQFIMEAANKEIISKTVEAADKDESVEGITIEGQDERVHFPREEFRELIQKNFESADMLPPDRVKEERAFLTILSMGFESGYLWQFLFNGFKIPMRVKDGALMEIIDKGARLGKGDVLDVTLEIVQRYNPSYKAYENVRFKIKEFHRHIPAQDPPSLFED